MAWSSKSSRCALLGFRWPIVLPSFGIHQVCSRKDEGFYLEKFENSVELIKTKQCDVRRDAWPWWFISMSRPRTSHLLAITNSSAISHHSTHTKRSTPCCNIVNNHGPNENELRLAAVFCWRSYFADNEWKSTTAVAWWPPFRTQWHCLQYLHRQLVWSISLHAVRLWPFVEERHYTGIFVDGSQSRGKFSP